ncbi:hypothetical protein C7M84_009872 [Penaeus vannamei]|uniref:Uncharacterized protein n=1 Tax=Penaeus vannamei TaxID=6689 RepID=A0A3R7MXA0_PENVA|nr:hypothetical protein C7M84_009872 [Penaeus vannamei]
MRNLRLSDHTSEALHNNSEGLLCVNPITSAIYHINKDGLGIIKGDSEGSPQLTWSSHDIQTSKIVQADFVTAINALLSIPSPATRYIPPAPFSPNLVSPFLSPLSCDLLLFLFLPLVFLSSPSSSTPLPRLSLSPPSLLPCLPPPSLECPLSPLSFSSPLSPSPSPLFLSSHFSPLSHQRIAPCPLLSPAIPSLPPLPFPSLLSSPCSPPSIFLLLCRLSFFPTLSSHLPLLSFPIRLPPFFLPPSLPIFLFPLLSTLSSPPSLPSLPCLYLSSIPLPSLPTTPHSPPPPSLLYLSSHSSPSSPHRPTPLPSFLSLLLPVSIYRFAFPELGLLRYICGRRLYVFVFVYI